MLLDLAALVEELRALRKDLRSTNTLVVLAVLLLNVLLSTVYYYAAFKRPYVRLTAIRQPVFDPRTQLPQRPLNALVGTGAATLALTLALHFLAARFDVHSWQEGLTMAAALLVIDSALNARHHFFEGRPLQLFLLHAGYHAITLAGTCCLLAVFGRLPPGHGGSRGGGGHSSDASRGAEL